MKRLTLQLIPLLLSYVLQGQVGIGTTTPHSSAIFEISSSSKGFLLPRLTQAQRDAIVDPAEGLIIYNTDSKSIDIYTGTTGNVVANWKGLSNPLQPSTNGSAKISTITDCNTASTGSLGTGVAITPNSVTQTITVEVTEVGTYSIEAEANGITFAKSGVFSTLGSQTIELIADGTPTATGTHSFTVNTTPNCSFDRTTAPPPPPPLPANITLTAGQEHYISSIYDNDYLPWETNTALSSTGPHTPTSNNGTETLINIGGELTTNGVTIRIPYSVSPGGSVDLPVFSQTRTIVSDHVRLTPGENSTAGGGTAHEVELSYDAQTNLTGDGFITATLKAVGSNYHPVKLDIHNGLGTDNGLTIAEFTIALSNQNNSTGTIKLKLISGIPDRNFADANHKFIYLPITAADGNVWLNNNLGANYANIKMPSVFNLAQQATAYNDHNAYGSLFQWGRYSDGHELINWTGATTGSPVTTTLSGAHSTTTTPNNSIYYTGDDSPQTQDQNWLDFGPSPNATEDGLWQGETGPNNPCPKGYRVPSGIEVDNLITMEGIKSNNAPLTSSDPRIRAANSSLAFTSIAYRWGTYLSFWSCYWTDEHVGSYAKYLRFNGSSIQFVNSYRAFGMGIRCIKD